MNILLISGGSGNDALVKGLKKIYPESNVRVLVNAYDAGKSTGVCRKVTNTLGVSDIRKNHSRMYKAMTAEPNKCFLEFYDSRYDFTKGHEAEEVIEKLKLWGLDDLTIFATRFFSRPESLTYDYKDFCVSNIIYSEMYAEIGYEKTNEYFTSLLGLEDFVILNSFDNVYIQAVTENGDVIEDEGDIVEYKNSDNKITSLKYEREAESLGLNPKAIESVNNADLLVISTGTFWSSIYPTLDYLDFYKYINDSRAKKIWAINNIEDKDSYGVGSNDFIKIVTDRGLDLSNFTILENNDAVESLRQENEDFNIIRFNMENNAGKHNGEKYATAILKIFYGLEDVNKFEHILFDFDDTIWARDKKLESTSIENTRLVNDIKNAVIVSGNSFESIRKKLSQVYGSELEGFNLDVWADANACLFRNGNRVDVIRELMITNDPTPLIQHLSSTYGITCTPNDERIVTCLKIKPLSPLDQCLVSNYLNDYLLAAAGLKGCVAAPTGKTTVDIVSIDNNKVYVLCRITDNFKSVLYIGDEVDAGNDQRISQLCGHAIHTHDVKEASVVLKLLKD